jgi:mannosyltransferase OCH1-like enzyme
MPERNPCMEGWESCSLFNYDYQIIALSEAEFNFLKACDANASQVRTVQEILLSAPLS